MPQLLKHLLPIALVAMTALSVQAETGVQSFREWKAGRISEAQVKVTQTRALMVQSRTGASEAQDPNMAIRGARTQVEAVPSKDIDLNRLRKELAEEMYDLELARDLSVTDYFVGYLTKVQNKKAAFQEVAGKLTPEEVAELMTAYANSVFGAQQTVVPASAANVSKDSVK